MGYEPIMLRMEARYHREATYREVVRDYPVTVAASPDFSRWKIRHSYTKGNGKKVGWVVLEGTWLNWKPRKAVAPDAEVAALPRDVPESSGKNPFNHLFDRRVFHCQVHHRQV